MLFGQDFVVSELIRLLLVWSSVVSVVRVSVSSLACVSLTSTVFVFSLPKVDPLFFSESFLLSFSFLSSVVAAAHFYSIVSFGDFGS